MIVILLLRRLALKAMYISTKVIVYHFFSDALENWNGWQLTEELQILNNVGDKKVNKTCKSHCYCFGAATVQGWQLFQG